MNRSAKVALADDLFRKRIRSRGFCQARGFLPYIRCGGILETSHVMPRRFMSVRWDDENAASICSIHHGWLTDNPHKAIDFHERLLGPERFAALKARAWEANGAPDMDEIIMRLRREEIR